MVPLSCIITCSPHHKWPCNFHKPQCLLLAKKNPKQSISTLFLEMSINNHMWYLAKSNLNYKWDHASNLFLLLPKQEQVSKFTRLCSTCAAHMQVMCVCYVFTFLRGYVVSCWFMFYFWPLLCSLVQWLKHSRKEYCELCKHRFAFTPSKYSGHWCIIPFYTINGVMFSQLLIEIYTRGFPICPQLLVSLVFCCFAKKMHNRNINWNHK